MSDILKFSPDSARTFITQNTRLRVLGALALSGVLSVSMPTPEGQPPLTRVKIGSNDSTIMDQLKDNDGANLRGGPSTNTAPIGKAPIGESFSVIEVVENGSWVKVQLDPEENIPDIDMNYELLPVNEEGQVIIPTEVFVSRNLVKKTKNRDK